MEQILTALDVLQLKTPRMITVPPEATLAQAIEKMIEYNIGAILVKAGDELVGIWTERDHLRNTLMPGYDPKTNRIGDSMQTELYSTTADTSIMALQDIFLGLFIRHILIVDEGKYIGLLSIGDVIRAALLHKDREIKELNQIASWEYYENWGWDRKHRDKKKNKE
ncbi:MAG: CBS domain-containing protein [Thermodesulfobacteriota bacterium]